MIAGVKIAVACSTNSEKIVWFLHTTDVNYFYLVSASFLTCMKNRYTFLLLIGVTSQALAQIPIFTTPQPASIGSYGSYPAAVTPQVEQTNRQVMQQMGVQPPPTQADIHRQMMEEVDAYYRQQQEEKNRQAQEENQRELYQQAYRYAVSCYDSAYGELAAMLTRKTKPDLKRAVFVTENAFFENGQSYGEFCGQLELMANLCKQQVAAGAPAASGKLAQNLAIYRFMCDTTLVYGAGEKVTGVHLPMQYDFEDYKGEQDYTKMFVLKLMHSHTGQCHSLPLLYKLLAEELQAEAYLSYAPNHTYIQHRDDAGNWYNLELTSGCYVTESFLMASGYVKAEALKNRIYMDTLSLRQTIGQCVVDLALGYEAKFGEAGDDAFVLRCCDLVLQEYPNHVQAWMVKADVMTQRLANAARQAGVTSAAEAAQHPPVYALQQQVEHIYAQIDNLGYAPMPAEQYEAWLQSVQVEKEKRESQRILREMQNN